MAEAGVLKSVKEPHQPPSLCKCVHSHAWQPRKGVFERGLAWKGRILSYRGCRVKPEKILNLFSFSSLDIEK
jgi:hypothetical protein